MSEATLEALWNSLPDEVVAEPEFDSFFVGAGNSELLSKYNSPRSFANQLLAGFKGVTVPVRDDLARFDGEVIEVSDDSMYEELFLKHKERAFSMFDYLKVKSASIGSAPIKEKDLIVNDEDRRFIEGLKFLTKDYFVVASLAALSAFDEMGIFNVKFVEKDGCALCKAFDGLVLNVREVMERLQSGKGISHRYCDCRFFPIVQRRYVYEKLSDENLNVEDVELEDEGREQMVINIPVETSDILLDLVKELPNEVVEFVNMAEYIEDHLGGDQAYVDTVIYEDEEGILFVDNNYTQDGKGPVDFLKAYLETEPVPERRDRSDLKGLEVLYYKGHKVVELDGKYWDKDTGKRIE